VQRARGFRRDVVERIERDVEKAFAAAKLPVQITGREKTLYSIYRKMREKHLSFAQVSDIFGFRIVTHELLDCYKALGVLHQLYKPLPGRFKDYIAIPKPNGYQSLHTTLVNPVGTAVEFQIRSQVMHDVAEKGIAAHWMYKEQADADDASPQQAAVWLQSLIDIQHETRDSADFLEHLKIDLFPESVYVLTPQSRIVALPKGATPVDFAYAIHSGVGDKCASAKVNGEPVALRTELRSGDVVEIVTAAGAKPNPAWLTFVRTGRARSKIRAYLKNMEAEESLALGIKLLTQALRAEGLTLPPGDETSEGATGALWQELIRLGGNRSRDELLIDIGLGRKVASMAAKRLAHLMAESGQRPDALTLTLGRFTDEAPTHSSVVIDGSEGATVRLSPCCCPVPGDRIRGYLGRGEGLVVHTQTCAVGRRLFERDGERWIDVNWSDEPTRMFETVLKVLVANGKGVLAQVAGAISRAETDITHIEMGNERLGETAELKLTLEVRDTEHLAEVIRSLKRCPVVLNAERLSA